MDVHYHVGHGVPGGPPEHAAICANTPDAALFEWRADVRDALKAITDSGEYLELDTQQNLVTCSDVERSQRLSLSLPDGRQYVLERVAGAHTTCPAQVLHIFRSHDNNPGCDCGINPAVARLKGGEHICSARAVALGLNLPATT